MGDILLDNRQGHDAGPRTGRQVRVAAVGCGYWGKNLVRNFAELGALGGDLRSQSRRGGRTRRSISASPSPSSRRSCGDADIAGVAIAAPAVLHAELARPRYRGGQARLRREAACA